MHEKSYNVLLLQMLMIMQTHAIFFETETTGSIQTKPVSVTEPWLTGQAYSEQSAALPKLYLLVKCGKMNGESGLSWSLYKCGCRSQMEGELLSLNTLGANSADCNCQNHL